MTFLGSLRYLKKTGQLTTQNQETSQCGHAETSYPMEKQLERQWLGTQRVTLTKVWDPRFTMFGRCFRTTEWGEAAYFHSTNSTRGMSFWCSLTWTTVKCVQCSLCVTHMLSRGKGHASSWGRGILASWK